MNFMQIVDKSNVCNEIRTMKEAENEIAWRIEKE